MTTFFEHIRGGFSIHVDAEGSTVPAVRFCLARFGEDADRVLAAFWREVGAGDFELVPLFAYGSAPRAELCTARSLAAALQTASIEPGSRTEQQWKAVCEHHNVAWPKRLTPQKPKAA